MKFVKVEGLIVNLAHVAYAEWKDNILMLHLALGTSDPGARGVIAPQSNPPNQSHMKIPLQGEEAKAVWAALEALV